MLLAPRSKTKRPGDSIVEFALVATVFFMLIFGVLEYCLMLYTWDLMQNAAREGARYYIVNNSIVATGNTTNGSAAMTFPSTSNFAAGMSITGNGIGTGTTILSVDSATQITLSQAATVTSNINVVYASTNITDTQNYVKTLMMGQDTKNTNYSCSVYLADANGNNINSGSSDATTARFGQTICVQVSLTYSPITPTLLFMSKSINLQTKCCMGSEGN